MKKTFGQQLKQFALSVDIIDDNTFDQIKRIIQRYVEDELKMEYFELMVETSAGGDSDQVFLKTIWGNKELINPLKNRDGSYTNQTAFAFDQDHPLWVVAEDKNTLESSDSHIDLWSNQTNLPEFEGAGGNQIRTAIAVPIKLKSGKMIGVLAMESNNYLEKTEIARKEIKNIADTVSIVLTLRDYNKSQKRNTLNAIDSLSKDVGKNKLQNLSKPKLFFAFSSKGDPLVIEAITEVLYELKDKLSIVLWDKMIESGDIITQMTHEILTSSFGVCYFSEFNGEEKFKDNFNVVFEAGMLYALTSYEDAAVVGWIPIREKKSPKLPFDFSTQRIIMVDRYESDDLKKASFQQTLRERLSELVNKTD